MFYSCELLDLHIKVSTEGFGTLHCFLKQIVTNAASEFGFIVFQIGRSRSPFLSLTMQIVSYSLCFLVIPSWMDGWIKRVHLNIVVYLVYCVLEA